MLMFAAAQFYIITLACCTRLRQSVIETVSIKMGWLPAGRPGTSHSFAPGGNCDLPMQKNPAKIRALGIHIIDRNFSHLSGGNVAMPSFTRVIFGIADRGHLP